MSESREYPEEIAMPTTCAPSAGGMHRVPKKGLQRFETIPGPVSREVRTRRVERRSWLLQEESVPNTIHDSDVTESRVSPTKPVT